MATLGVRLVVLEAPAPLLDSISRGTRSDSDWPRHHQLGQPAEISGVERTWVGKCEKLSAGSQGSKIAGRDSSRSEILDLGCEGCVWVAHAGNFPRISWVHMEVALTWVVHLPE